MEPAKFCIECGNPLPPEAKHCPNCGAEVADLHLTPSDGVRQTPLTQEPLPQPVGSGPYSATLAPPPGMPIPQPAQAAPYGGPGAPHRSPYVSAPAGPVAYPQATTAPGFQRMRGVGSAKRLGGGLIAILGGVVMLVAQGFFMSKGSQLNLLNVGLGFLCLASGVIALVVRGWGPVIVGALLSGGVFALCGLKLYQTILWVQTQAPEVVTSWALRSGGIIWIGGMMLGMVAFAKAFQSLFRH